MSKPVFANISFDQQKQVKELIEKRILKSNADLIILGGDLNDVPVDKKDFPYHMLVREMQNCIEELFCESGQWLKREYATFRHLSNTFSDGEEEPQMIDYIFKRNNSPQKLRSWTSSFQFPMLKTPYDDVELMSVSDHEAMVAEIQICPL